MKTPTYISPDRAKKQYRVQMMVAMTLYVVAVLSCAYYLKHGNPQGALKVTLAMLPTLPVIWVMWALVVYLRRADELERRVHTTALSIAAGATALVCLVYGFMEDFAGFPHLAAWWYFVLIDMVWGAACCVLWKRYK